MVVIFGVVLGTGKNIVQTNEVKDFRRRLLIKRIHDLDVHKLVGSELLKITQKFSRHA